MDLVVDEEEWSSSPPLQRAALRRAATRLRTDPAAVGQRIERARWPPRFRIHENLFRLPLPEGWRAIYTVRARKGEAPAVLVLFIGDHKRYDRLFGYKGGS